MSKCKCKDCGEIYEEKWTTDFYGFDHFYGCTKCGSIAREPVYKCVVCGEYFPEDELNDDDVCVNCVEVDK